MLHIFKGIYMFHIFHMFLYVLELGLGFFLFLLGLSLSHAYIKALLMQMGNTIFINKIREFIFSLQNQICIYWFCQKVQTDLLYGISLPFVESCTTPVLLSSHSLDHRGSMCQWFFEGCAQSCWTIIHNSVVLFPCDSWAIISSQIQVNGRDPVRLWALNSNVAIPISWILMQIKLLDYQSHADIAFVLFLLELLSP